MEYSEKVMDHFMNPRNVGEIENASGVGQVGNMKCGDIMKVYLQIEDGKIVDAKFKTFGCGAAVATSSMATELVKGKSIQEALEVTNKAVNETLSSEAISYGDLVTLEKDTAGQVTVLAANTAQLNALRTEILGRILEQVEQLDSQELGIPLGNLTGFATASDLGPVLPVRVLTAATPTAAFEHVFTSSGINQTLHQVMLNVQVECTLLIPGGTVDTVVEAQVCAAETLLVGQVPDTYLELPGGL